MPSDFLTRQLIVNAVRVESSNGLSQLSFPGAKIRPVVAPDLGGCEPAAHETSLRQKASKNESASSELASSRCTARVAIHVKMTP